MDRSSSKLQEIVKDKEAWGAWGHKESDMTGQHKDLFILFLVFSFIFLFYYVTEFQIHRVRPRYLLTNHLYIFISCGLYTCTCVYILSRFSRTLRDPTDYSLPSSSGYGILQAGRLDLVAMPFCKWYSWPTGWNPCLLDCRQILYCWAPREFHAYPQKSLDREDLRKWIYTVDLSLWQVSHL